MNHCGESLVTGSGMTYLPHGTTGGTKALGEESVPEFRIVPCDSSEPLGIETGVDCYRILLDEPQKYPGSSIPNRRELVLVEADRDHRGAALGDALPGKQRHKNIRGWAGTLPEKEN